MPSSQPPRRRANKKAQQAAAPHGLKRNVGERSAPNLAAATAAAGSPKKENSTQPSKHQRQNSNKAAAAAAAAAAPRPGPQASGKGGKGKAKPAQPQATPPRAPPAKLASKFAGPAFTNSPTPECLPIPTSRFLMQDAADNLRSRLTL